MILIFRHLLIAGLFIFSILACTRSDVGSEEERNKKIVLRTHEEIWSNGNIALVDELYAPDFVCHWATGLETRGVEELKKNILTARADIPDLRENIELILAEGNLVATYWRAHGTFTGNIQGISQKNQKIALQEMAIYRIVQGKIVEQWMMANNLLLMQQFGLELRPIQPYAEGD
jgi:predicted ester cyclase